MEQSNVSYKPRDVLDAPSQIEDKVLKTAAMFFGQELLPYLGVKGRMTAIAPTEQVHLDVRRMEEDFNFIMEDGVLRHLEFESDPITEKDLRRFREYEAFLSLTSGHQVITTVLCSADVRNPKTNLNCGINVYRIELVRIKDDDADRVFNDLEMKMGQGGRLTRSDLFPLLLAPLMSGNMDICGRICRGMDILRMAQVDADKDDIRHMEAVLYALAIKFLNKTDLAKVKEMMGMTLLGQMLMEDGIKKGLKKGEMTKLISQVIKKAKKGLSPEETAEILEEDPMVISRIYHAVKEYPDMDEDGIYRQLYN